MPRYALEIAYDGGDFLGWQSQPHGRTVQDALSRALFEIGGERAVPYGAGRTDVGVHAMAQVAHVDLAREWEPRRLTLALNAKLPPGVSVMRSARVGDDFHARHGAISREYRYFIWNAPTCYPHIKRYVTWLPGAHDWRRAAALCPMVEGEHDFRAFCRAVDCPDDATRTVTRARLFVRGRLVVLRIEARGFLTNMVRIIAGNLREVARGARGEEWFASLFDPGTERTKSAQTLGSEGLVFWRARYAIDPWAGKR